MDIETTVPTPKRRGRPAKAINRRGNEMTPPKVPLGESRKEKQEHIDEIYSAARIAEQREPIIEITNRHSVRFTLADLWLVGVIVYAVVLTIGAGLVVLWR